MPQYCSLPLTIFSSHLPMQFNKEISLHELTSALFLPFFGIIAIFELFQASGICHNSSDAIKMCRKTSIMSFGQFFRIFLRYHLIPGLLSNSAIWGGTSFWLGLCESPYCLGRQHALRTIQDRGKVNLAMRKLRLDWSQTNLRFLHCLMYFDCQLLETYS